ncbi:carboxypeptidase-like regulatory domain-containing protein [Micromonospora sp. NPDC050495]|uniref:carboxypeptidase-like regulatory domain-containing protein n=1 Tax=Micromonospora sp. NPDC050495 TaxID=3154936 RepID=UPI0033EB4DCD
MSTHRRAWQQRAGVIVALVFGALLTVPATPASATDPSVSITSLSTGTLQSGQSTPMSFSVTNKNDSPTAFSINVDTFNGLSCRGDCNVPARLIAPNESASITVTLVADNLGTGETKSGQVRVSAKSGGDQASDARDMTVKGAPAPPQQPQTVKSVSGKVVASANSEPVSGALVMLRDSQNRQYRTTSDGSGNFRFSGSTSNPIAPGRLDLGASKDNKNEVKSIDAAAGQSVTGVRIGLAIEVKATPSPTPSASEEALPSEEATEEASEEPASEAPAAQQPTASEDSGGMSSWLLILLGGLFVAVGVGTIVLLYVRRKNDDADGDGPAGVGAAAGGVPPARGGYRGADDQTRVVNGMGAGAAPTMIGSSSLSDAPTMMHRPVVDDVPPDPYGAPPAPAYGGGQGAGWAGGGYGDEGPGQGYGNNGYGNAPSSGSGYGNAPSSGSGYGSGPQGAGYGNAPSSGSGYGSGPQGAGYGNAPSSGGGYGNAPSSGGGYGSRDYGAGAGGYPPAQGGGYGGERYDEPTGRYTGDGTQYTPPADPYPTSTYQPDPAPGYGQPDPAPAYGQPDQGRHGLGGEQGGYGTGGGYGAQGGYDAGAPYDSGSPGGYGNGPQGGYDNRPAGGYDSAPQGGYDGGQPGYDGYDQRAGYGGDAYGQQGGYGQEPPPQQRTGGYDDPGYDQAGYYGDQAQAGRTRPDAPQDRSGRRLDWLDD